MEKSGFFNSVNGDRKYKASDFAEYFNSFVSNGVFPNPSNNLQVMSNNNMTVTLASGKAWINGYVYINTTDLIHNIDVADGALNRIDRLVLKFDTVNRTIQSDIKKGVFASNPVAPTLQRDADAFELGIADIYIGKGVTSISQANITDLRLNNDYCGIVNSIMQADTTTLLNQYTQGFADKEVEFEQAFNDWFVTIQNVLDGDTAGNLLNLINGIAGAGRTTETVKGNADAIATLDNDLTSHKAEDATNAHKAVNIAMENGTDMETTISNLGTQTASKQSAIKLKTGSDFTTADLANGEIGIVY